MNYSSYNNSYNFDHNFPCEFTNISLNKTYESSWPNLKENFLNYQQSSEINFSNNCLYSSLGEKKNESQFLKKKINLYNVNEYNLNNCSNLKINTNNDLSYCLGLNKNLINSDNQNCYTTKFINQPSQTMNFEIESIKSFLKSMDLSLIYKHYFSRFNFFELNSNQVYLNQDLIYEFILDIEEELNQHNRLDYEYYYQNKLSKDNKNLDLNNFNSSDSIEIDQYLNFSNSSLSSISNMSKNISPNLSLNATNPFLNDIHTCLPPSPEQLEYQKHFNFYQLKNNEQNENFNSSFKTSTKLFSDIYQKKNKQDGIIKHLGNSIQLTKKEFKMMYEFALMLDSGNFWDLSKLSNNCAYMDVGLWIMENKNILLDFFPYNGVSSICFNEGDPNSIRFGLIKIAPQFQHIETPSEDIILSYALLNGELDVFYGKNHKKLKCPNSPFVKISQKHIMFNSTVNNIFIFYQLRKF